MEETKRHVIKDETTHAEKKELSWEPKELDIQKHQLIEDTEKTEAPLTENIEALKKQVFYTITAPKVVRPYSEYHVAISTTGISEPSTIRVELSADLDSGDVFNVSQITTVEPYTTRVIKFEMKDTTPGRYKLVSQGLSGIEFHSTTDLKYVHKSYSVFIQTDRAVYKPGNKVLFRAVVLDSRLRPAQSGTELDIYITDGQGNRVKQWKQRMDDKGVFSGELQLSNELLLGDWKISVKINDQTFEKVFQVGEYVLPKFEVTIDVPKDANFKDSAITATVRAKYTYGKPVKGEATITAYPSTFYDYFEPTSQPMVRKVVPIDGKATVNFDIIDELRLKGDYDQPVQFDVTVEEALTGNKQNTSARMDLRKHRYTMELINTAASYKPGLKYTAFIKIAYHDGSPVQDKINPVEILYKFSPSYDDSPYTSISRMLDDHGMIKLDLYSDPARNFGVPLAIEAQYLNLHERFSSVYPPFPVREAYIQAALKTDNPMVSKDVEIEVNSTVPLKYFSYEVLGRGDILVADSIQLSGKNTATFRFFATHEMAPTAHVVVYYTRDDGEIIADALNVHLNGTLQNFVDIATTPQETQPGESVDLVITSKPNSYVGLLGVDQSSILLKSGNDISYEQVSNELKSYDIANEDSWSSSLWNPGSTSTYNVFKESGVVVLTNGLIARDRPAVLLSTSLGGAFTAISTPRPDTTMVQPAEKVKVRKNFPETWLWQMIDAGPDGKTVLQRSVPDTITSWVLTAFSVDSDHGFGLIEEPRKLKVFQPFFVSLNLPYSVIRGEIVAITIVVFNYMDKDVSAEVTLENEGQFEFAEAANDVHDNPKLELYRKKNVEVKAASGASVSFIIVPKELGHIVIKATATSALAGDSVEQKLLVKPEGEIQYRNKAIFVDLRNSTSLDTNFVIDIPENSVNGSEHIEVSAVGDILGPSLPNLANLLQIPSGCGEQNMLNFVPNIVVINYLKSINQLTPAVQGKALKFLEVGYQQELTYRHADGSFSAFGKSDASGSTWLTAFVAKSFIQAAEHITIEDRIIKEALQWLANNQSPDGNFPEVGTVIHSEIQGGAAKGLALTAFTLIAFLENQNYIPEYRDTINKGVEYIVKNLESLDDVYSLCICSYVLNLAKHQAEDVAFGMLQARAEESENYKWWSKLVAKDDKNPWHLLPSSVNVEMTSYAMLTYLRRNMATDSIPIMKWLVTQRNANGGFASTQDTVIGIYAFSKLGEKLSSQNTNIAISCTTEGGEKTNLNVDSENNTILKKYALPGKTRAVNVSATGTGFAIIQVSYRYNMNVTGAWPLFTLDPQVDKNTDSNHLRLEICSGFIPTKEVNESNMAVMEVSLPSGFTVDADSLESLRTSQHVMRVETKNGDTMIILYFDKMVKEKYCITVNAFRMHKVAKQKPVPVSIYDYYDSTRRARVFYEPRVATLCDICEGGDCEMCETRKTENEMVGTEMPVANATSLSSL